jgi:hypothetical protein
VRSFSAEGTPAGRGFARSRSRPETPHRRVRGPPGPRTKRKASGIAEKRFGAQGGRCTRERRYPFDGRGVNLGSRREDQDGGFGRRSDPSGSGRRLRPSPGFADQRRGFTAVVGFETDRNDGFGRRSGPDGSGGRSHDRNPGPQIRTAASRPQGRVWKRNGTTASAGVPAPDGFGRRLRPRPGSAGPGRRLHGRKVGFWKRIGTTASAGVPGSGRVRQRPRGCGRVRGSGRRLHGCRSDPETDRDDGFGRRSGPDGSGGRLHGRRPGPQVRTAASGPQVGSGRFWRRLHRRLRSLR